MKHLLVTIVAVLLCGCTLSHHSTPPAPIAADVFDAMMLGYQTNGVPDTIRLAAGTYLTRGSRAWTLSPGDSLVGTGMGKTTLRRMDPQARFVVNGWIAQGNAGARVADLTLDANAGLVGAEAPCGLGVFHWRDCTIERVRVIRLGSFSLLSESFGIIPEDCTNLVVRDCIVEQNVGGYVTAYTISGKRVTLTNCVANFVWQPTWLKHLAAFATAGMGPDGSQDVTIAGNRTSGARYGIYSDYGTKIDRLTITGNSGTLRSHGYAPAQEIFLTGQDRGVQYFNVRTNANNFTIAP